MTTMQTALQTPILARGRSLLGEAVGVLASVRLAAGLGAAIALLSLAGMLVPQLPELTRGNPVATAEWLDGQRRSLGPAAGWMYWLGLFDVFHSIWMVEGLGYSRCRSSPAPGGGWRQPGATSSALPGPFPTRSLRVPGQGSSMAHRPIPTPWNTPCAAATTAWNIGERTERTTSSPTVSPGPSSRRS